MQEKKYIVYKHTSPSNKIYIGITCQEPKKRWLNGKGYQTNDYFTRAIEKYSWDNFKHEILFRGLTKEEAEKKEVELIKFYQCNKKEFGYNVENGGNSIGKHCEETCKKISESKRGHNVSEETRMKLSLIHKGKAYRKGAKHSEESKKKMSVVKRNMSDETKEKFRKRQLEL